MKPSQSEIIFTYLLKGVEVVATYQHTDKLNENIEITGFINCKRIESIYHCLVREIRSDNQSDYFDDYFYDRNEESIFHKIEDLLEHIKSNTNLSLDNFRKAKNDIHYRD